MMTLLKAILMFLKQEELESVNMDHNQIREFLMISLGEKPSESFSPTCARIVLERVWRVLNIHQEFRDLRTRDKRAIFGIVGPLGFALIIAKQENNTCAMKQLKVKFDLMSVRK